MTVKMEVTPQEIRAFKVTDGNKPCATCGLVSKDQQPAPFNLPAPVLIKGKHYCLWCAFEMAREHMVGA
jgi:hypothetical protein